MKIYVINMERSTHRRKSMEEHLRSMGLDYEIVAAVDGSTLEDNYPQESLSKQGPLNKSELGCMLSHLKIYQMMQERNDEFALVLEDDVLINELGMPDMFGTMEHFLSRETVTLLTYFGTKNEKVSLKKVQDESLEGKSENYFICSPPSPNNLSRAGAYIVPKRCAKKMIDFHRTNIHCRADEWEIYYHNGILDIVNCIYPMPVTENFQHGSEINYTKNRVEALGKKIISWTIHNNLPVIAYLFKKRRESYSSVYKNIVLES